MSPVQYSVRRWRCYLRDAFFFYRWQPKMLGTNRSHQDGTSKLNLQEHSLNFIYV